MENNERPEQPRPFVDALLACTCLMSQILDHMYRHPAADPDAPPPMTVLANLLEGVLAPRFEEGGGLDGATAALEQTASAIEGEIYLVPETSPNGEEG
jgi:hypothetical protein